ncbi:MAG TPA: metallophosphoesterase [Bryobacteraceae bacterium]
MIRTTAVLALIASAPLLNAAGLFFVQMSDPQFGMYTSNADFSQETANFEFAIANVNRLRPSFVVVCGDLVNRADDVAQAAEYLRVAARLDRSIPLHNVAGNHDVENTPTPASLAAYRAKFGPDYYTFRHADFTGIVLNSSLIQHPEGAPQETAKQETWLLAQLQKFKAEGARNVAVFQHIPFFLERADEADQYFNIPLERRRKYLEILLKYGIRNVFAGHYHRNTSGRSGALQMITTGPVGKPLGPDPSGIRVVIVRETTMESQYYGLGNIPNQVDLSAPAHSKVGQVGNLRPIGNRPIR